MIIHQKEQFKCKCKISYTSDSSLRNHLKIKHKGKEEEFKIPRSPRPLDKKGRPSKEQKLKKQQQQLELAREQTMEKINDERILRSVMGKDYFIMEALGKQFTQKFICKNKTSLKYYCKIHRKQEENIKKCREWLNQMLKDYNLEEQEGGNDLEDEVNQFFGLVLIIKCSNMESLFKKTFNKKISQLKKPNCIQKQDQGPTNLEQSLFSLKDYAQAVIQVSPFDQIENGLMENDMEVQDSNEIENESQSNQPLFLERKNNSMNSPSVLSNQFLKNFQTDPHYLSMLLREIDIQELE